MGSSAAIEPFDTSAALAILDRILDRDEAVALNSVASAWEAAWIACLTSSATWTSVAEEEFGHVVIELHGMLWTVDRRRSRSASIGLGTMPKRRKKRPSLAAESFTPVRDAKPSCFEPGPF